MGYKVHKIDGKSGEVDLTYARTHSKTVTMPGAVAGTVHAWQAPVAVHITGVRVYQAAGSAGGTAQVTNAGANVLATPLAASANAWAATTTVQNAAVAAGAAVNVVAASLAGSPTEFTVQFDYTVDVV